jgi:hypothetical protein
MQRRNDDVRRLVMPQLDNQLCEVGFVGVDASSLQRLVELNLLRRHGLDLDDLGGRDTVGATCLHQIDHDLPSLLGVTGPVHDAARGSAVPLKHLQVEVQVLHGMPADLFA